MSEYKSIVEYERLKLENAKNTAEALAQRHADFLIVKESITNSSASEGLKHLRIYKLAIQCSEPIPVNTQEFLFNALSEIERIQRSSTKRKPQKQISQLKLTGGSYPKPFVDVDHQTAGQSRAIRFFTLRSQGVPINKANALVAEEANMANDGEVYVDERQVRRDRKEYPEAEDYVRGRLAFERAEARSAGPDK